MVILKKAQPLLKNVLIKNFYNLLEMNYNVKDYWKFQKELRIKLLILRKIVSLYYKQEFFCLIFNKIKAIFFINMIKK